MMKGNEFFQRDVTSMQQDAPQKANSDRRLFIRSANCLRRLSPRTHCDLCEKLCPAQALRWQDEHWTAASCTLCGQCAAVCPTQVFQIDLPRLLARAPAPLSICCRENRQAPPEALRLNCLRQFSPEALLFLLYRHGRLTLYLTPAQCWQCPEGWYAQGLAQQLARFGIPEDRLIVRLQAPPADADAVRAEETRAAAPAAAAAVDVHGASFFPARLPLRALYLSGARTASKEQALPWRMLGCSACSFCGACSRLCPTGALSFRDTGGGRAAECGDGAKPAPVRQLLFQPELCLGCDLCREVCLPRGLAWQDFLTPAQFLQSPAVLAESAEAICSVCGHPFYRYPPDADGRCRFCR